MGRSEHDDIAEVVRDQLDAAEHERPHEDLAQLGVCLHQRQQLLARELDHLTGCDRAQPRHRPAAGDHRRLAGELTRPMRDDECPGGGRQTSISPLRTTKKRTVLSPTSTRTSPAAMGRRLPRAAIRATCASVNVGNSRSLWDGAVDSNGTDLSVMALRWF